MLGAAFNETYSVAGVNAALIALMLVLPALLVGYVRQASRRVSADFALRRLEAFELDRAEVQYRKISQRMSEIDRLAKSGTGSLWKRLRHRADISQQYRAELDDSAHRRASPARLDHAVQAAADPAAAHLGARDQQPLRVRQFAGVLSDDFGARDRLHLFLRATAVGAGPRLHARDRHPLEAVRRRAPALRQRDHVRVRADAGAAALRHAAGKLYSDHRMQTKALRDFAVADPDRLVQDDTPITAALDDPLLFESNGSDNCFAILGLSPAATADEIKEAYRTKIRLSHPDRVHGLAPAFRLLAEAETKKLNAAYEEALVAIQVAEPVRSRTRARQSLK